MRDFANDNFFITKGKSKILVISTGKFSGTTASLIAALRNHGYDVTDGKITFRGLRFKHLRRLWILINALLVYRTNFQKLLRRTYAAYVTYSKASALLVKKHKGTTDVVVMIGANFLNFWRRKEPGVLYTVFTDHTNILSKRLPDYGFPVLEKNVHTTWNKIERNILFHQDHVFVMGSHVKNSVVTDYGINAAKVTVVGGGPNLDLDIERDGFVKRWDQSNILFVGLDAERKGLKVLERAFAKVKTRCPLATLHVVGPDGVSANGITYYGRISGEPLKKLFYESQIFVLPTFREPFGIVFLEAMLAKNVCIGTNIEAIPEIILNGESGYLIEPNDFASLADKILELFYDRPQLRKMGENGYRLARMKWGWDKSAERIIEALDEMTASSGRVRNALSASA
jgi:glycosyltransferase involved in cell wall biosynthesis